MNNRRVKLYISMSLDGFIATKEDDLSWLSRIEKEGEDYGYEKFNASVDTYIVGRATYDIILKLTGGHFPQADKFDCYVLTRDIRPSEYGVNFYTGSLEALITELKTKPGKDIYCDGGAQVVQLLMENQLIDEYIISVIPIILGDGKRLFLGGVPCSNLKALPPKYFDTGLVQLHYLHEN